MRASPIRRYSGQCKAAEKEWDPGTSGRHLKQEMDSRLQVGYSWRNMEVTAQNRAGWSQVV